MPETETPTGEYLYCVIRCPEPRKFGTRGIGERGDTVHTVHFNGLAAVVSASPVADYERTRRNMMAHTVVLEEVMQEFTILPVRFSTIAPSTHALQEQVLKRRYTELDGLLHEMEGRVELGVKAFWYEEAIFREIVEETPAIRSLRDSLMGRSSEETYYDRIRLGEMVEAAMGKKREEDAEHIVARLSPLVHRTRTNKTLTDRMILNAAFLLDRDREPEFDQAVQQLDAEMGHRLMLKYVGPVPAYNFVNIVVHWDNGSR
ncbi:MAG: GvpL/GvpF family gas vesicle protein [Ardenticatenaceae bacterium]|nr:GvpL/GvpF family gas vesicle protein [Ardenticatenaceae bacterium]HBY99587.1 GvpL/GvpF-family gas vesicle protein 1 [Chloroflexota bacterium]